MVINGISCSGARVLMMGTAINGVFCRYNIQVERVGFTPMVKE
jgi:hypothetical protein